MACLNRVLMESRGREGAKSGGEMVEVVERENVGITFGRRIMFMLPSSC